jgi:c(7)-type cytochrome triheme protein
MNRTRLVTAVLVALAALLLMAAGTVYATGGGKASEAEEEAPVMSREEGLKTLPCFKCHSPEKFLSQSGEGFSHEMHGMMTGLHCNQCHEIKGHEMPNLKGAACGGCHSLGKMTYAGGGMGKVAFNHEAHGAMFSCNQCHPDTFRMKRGGVKMTMTPMYKGKLCGVCHNGQMAFASQACSKCHNMG